MTRTILLLALLMAAGTAGCNDDLSNYRLTQAKYPGADVIPMPAARWLVRDTNGNIRAVSHESFWQWPVEHRLFTNHWLGDGKIETNNVNGEVEK